MNADIPYLRCWVRLPAISRKDGAEEAYAFGIQSFPGRALGFHVMLKSGAHYRNVPIHAIALSPEAPERTVEDCQMWDCFSHHPVVTVFQYLHQHACTCYLRSGPADGAYLFTVDWLPDAPERPGFLNCPEQHKCAHVIALQDGNLAAMPTNRIAWKDGYFVGLDGDPAGQGYTVQEKAYSAELAGWSAGDSSEYYYGLQKGATGKVDFEPGSDSIRDTRPS